MVEHGARTPDAARRSPTGKASDTPPRPSPYSGANFRKGCFWNGTTARTLSLVGSGDFLMMNVLTRKLEAFGPLPDADRLLLDEVIPRSGQGLE